MSSQPDSDIDTLAEIIRVDPALSAKILKYANSPLFRRATEIDSLQQAASLFGWGGMLNLSLSFSIASSMNSKETAALDYSYFWKHSLACAAASKQLAKSANYRKNDELFLPGLMQNIGMLAIESVSPEVYSELPNNRCSHTKLQETELESLNADHAAIGAWLLETWHLPSSIVQLVKFSHDKTEPNVEESVQQTANCVAMSDFIADCICCDDDDKNFQNAAKIVNNVMDFGTDKFLHTLERTIEEYKLEADLFEITTGDVSILDSISEVAKVELQSTEKVA